MDGKQKKWDIREAPRNNSILYTVNIVQMSLLSLRSSLASGLKTSFAVLHEFAKPS